MDPFYTPTVTKKPQIIGGFESEETESKDRIGFYEDETPTVKTEHYGELIGGISFNKKDSFAENFLSSTNTENTKPPQSEHKAHRESISHTATAVIGETFSGVATAAETTAKVTKEATKSVGDALLDLFELITGKRLPLIDKLFKKGESKPKAEKKPSASDAKTQEAEKAVADAKQEAQFRAAKMREVQQDVAQVEQKRIQELTQDALRILGAGLEEVADIVDAKSDVAQTKSFIAKIGSGMSNISKITKMGKSSITLAKQKTTWAQEAQKKASMSAASKNGQQAVNLHGIAEGSTGGASSNLSSTGGGAG